MSYFDDEEIKMDIEEDEEDIDPLLEDDLLDDDLLDDELIDDDLIDENDEFNGLNELE